VSNPIITRGFDAVSAHRGEGQAVGKAHLLSFAGGYSILRFKIVDVGHYNGEANPPVPGSLHRFLFFSAVVANLGMFSG
jgi:hypothetical protein